MNLTFHYLEADSAREGEASRRVMSALRALHAERKITDETSTTRIGILLGEALPDFRFEWASAEGVFVYGPGAWSPVSALSRTLGARLAADGTRWLPAVDLAAEEVKP